MMWPSFCRSLNKFCTWIDAQPSQQSVQVFKSTRKVDPKNKQIPVTGTSSRTETTFGKILLYIHSCSWAFSFTHIWSANAEGKRFMIYTAASHKGAIQMVWLNFYGSLILSIFLLQSVAETIFTAQKNGISIETETSAEAQTSLQPDILWHKSQSL